MQGRQADFCLAFFGPFLGNAKKDAEVFASVSTEKMRAEKKRLSEALKGRNCESTGRKTCAHVIKPQSPQRNPQRATEMLLRDYLRFSCCAP